MSTLVLSPYPVDAERLRATLAFLIRSACSRVAAYEESGAAVPADLAAELRDYQAAMAEMGERPDLKLPDGTVARFAGPALTYPEPAAWARLLWRYPAIRAAIAEKEGAF